MKILKTIGFLMIALAITAVIIFYKAMHPPPLHIEKHPTIPGEIEGMVNVFKIPSSATDVYYFSAKTIRCGYYISVVLPEKDFEDYLNSMNSRIKPDTSGQLPPVSSRAEEYIKAWWPQELNKGLTVYRVFPQDYMIIDHKNSRIYAIRGED